ncbi:hypothetical protein MTO96_020478 [Rhipicephalus appendiculatus]
MTNPPTEKNRNPTSGIASPDPQARRVIRVAAQSAQSAEDVVAPRTAVLAHLHRPGTGSAHRTAGRVQHKQVHTHSVRDLRDLREDMSDDEGVSVVEELPTAPRLGVGRSARGNPGCSPGRVPLRGHDTQPSEGSTRRALTVEYSGLRGLRYRTPVVHQSRRPRLSGIFQN